MTLSATLGPGTTERRSFSTLDGLRGVAAASVVIYHFPSLWAPLTAPSAYLAVDLFFLMSGFIIEHAYGGKLAAGLGTRRFLLGRLIRLYPLYLIGTAITALVIAVALLSGEQGLKWTLGSLGRSVVWSALMLPTPHSGRLDSLYPLNVPAWSLFYELLVNGLFAATYRWWSRGRLRAVVAVAALVLGYSCWSAGSLNLGSDHGACAAVTAVSRVTFSFFLGVYACRQRWALRLPGGWTPPPPLLLIGTLLLLTATVPPAARACYDLVLVTVLFPLLLVAATASEPRVGRRGYAWLGLTSYAVYVVHEPLLRTLLRVDRAVLGGTVERCSLFSGLAALVVVFLLGAGLDRVYDVPVRRWLARRLLLSGRR